MLRYDFEMYPVDTAHCASEVHTDKRMTSQGHTRSNTVVAFFRDPKTKNVVTSAPPILRLFLEEAGFHLSDSDQWAPNTVPAKSDDDLRRALAVQLTAALSNRALKKALARAANETEFDVASFIAAVVSKQTPQGGLDDAAPQCVVTPRSPSQVRAQRRYNCSVRPR
ncbi:hypothetical protein BC777_2875 [Yoonia maricola]|uniref:Uncharacterized protein n=1 Tax=Yoonia maricola TaxID=420999 RepID=A0A2M8W6F1_9RHOB|nr:hypothetical protein [Yoonia maricola]PJI86505.1 hypothetical protein BC777_2875 [Yoonia maricola]